MRSGVQFSISLHWKTRHEVPGFFFCKRRKLACRLVAKKEAEAREAGGFSSVKHPKRDSPQAILQIMLACRLVAKKEAEARGVGGFPGVKHPQKRFVKAIQFH